MEVHIIPNIPRFKRSDVIKDKDYIYLFSDNAERTAITSERGVPAQGSWYEDKYGEFLIPRKSQARIRGIHNAYPITTLLNKEHDQWSDKKYEEYKLVIDDDIANLLDAIHKGSYKGIKVLDKTFGDESLSAMKHVAPKCFKYLTEKLREVNIDNMTLGTRRLDAKSLGGKNFILSHDLTLSKDSKEVHSNSRRV